MTNESTYALSAAMKSKEGPSLIIPCLFLIGMSTVLFALAIRVFSVSKRNTEEEDQMEASLHHEREDAELLSKYTSILFPSTPIDEMANGTKISNTCAAPSPEIDSERENAVQELQREQQELRLRWKHQRPSMTMRWYLFCRHRVTLKVLLQCVTLCTLSVLFLAYAIVIILIGKDFDENMVMINDRAHKKLSVFLEANQFPGTSSLLSSSHISPQNIAFSSVVEIPSNYYDTPSCRIMTPISSICDVQPLVFDYMPYINGDFPDRHWNGDRNATIPLPVISSGLLFYSQPEGSQWSATDQCQYNLFTTCLQGPTSGTLLGSGQSLLQLSIGYRFSHIIPKAVKHRLSPLFIDFLTNAGVDLRGVSTLTNRVHITNRPRNNKSHDEIFSFTRFPSKMSNSKSQQTNMGSALLHRNATITISFFINASFNMKRDDSFLFRNRILLMEDIMGVTGRGKSHTTTDIPSSAERVACDTKILKSALDVSSWQRTGEDGVRTATPIDTNQVPRYCIRSGGTAVTRFFVAQEEELPSTKPSSHKPLKANKNGRYLLKAGFFRSYYTKSHPFVESNLQVPLAFVVWDFTEYITSVAGDEATISHHLLIKCDPGGSIKHIIDNCVLVVDGNLRRPMSTSKRYFPVMDSGNNNIFFSNGMSPQDSMKTSWVALPSSDIDNAGHYSVTELYHAQVGIHYPYLPISRNSNITVASYSLSSSSYSLTNALVSAGFDIAKCYCDTPNCPAYLGSTYGQHQRTSLRLIPENESEKLEYYQRCLMGVGYISVVIGILLAVASVGLRMWSASSREICCGNISSSEVADVPGGVITHAIAGSTPSDHKSSQGDDMMRAPVGNTTFAAGEKKANAKPGYVANHALGAATTVKQNFTLSGNGPSPAAFRSPPMVPTSATTNALFQHLISPVVITLQTLVLVISTADSPLAALEIHLSNIPFIYSIIVPFLNVLFQFKFIGVLFWKYIILSIVWLVNKMDGLVFDVKEFDRIPAIIPTVVIWVLTGGLMVAVLLLLRHDEKELKEVCVPSDVLAAIQGYENKPSDKSMSTNGTEKELQVTYTVSKEDIKGTNPKDVSFAAQLQRLGAVGRTVSALVIFEQLTQGSRNETVPVGGPAPCHIGQMESIPFTGSSLESGFNALRMSRRTGDLTLAGESSVPSVIAFPAKSHPRASDTVPSGSYSRRGHVIPLHGVNKSAQLKSFYTSLATSMSSPTFILAARNIRMDIGEGIPSSLKLAHSTQNDREHSRVTTAYSEGESVLYHDEDLLCPVKHAPLLALEVNLGELKRKIATNKTRKSDELREIEQTQIVNEEPPVMAPITCDTEPVIKCSKRMTFGSEGQELQLPSDKGSERNRISVHFNQANLTSTISDYSGKEEDRMEDMEYIREELEWRMSVCRESIRGCPTNTMLIGVRGSVNKSHIYKKGMIHPGRRFGDILHSTDGRLITQASSVTGFGSALRVSSSRTVLSSVFKEANAIIGSCNLEGDREKCVSSIPQCSEEAIPITGVSVHNSLAKATDSFSGPMALPILPVIKIVDHENGLKACPTPLSTRICETTVEASVVLSENGDNTTTVSHANTPSHSNRKREGNGQLSRYGEFSDSEEEPYFNNSDDSDDLSCIIEKNEEQAPDVSGCNSNPSDQAHQTPILESQIIYKGVETDMGINDRSEGSFGREKTSNVSVPKLDTESSPCKSDKSNGMTPCEDGKIGSEGGACSSTHINSLDQEIDPQKRKAPVPSCGKAVAGGPISYNRTNSVINTTEIHNNTKQVGRKKEERVNTEKLILKDKIKEPGAYTKRVKYFIEEKLLFEGVPQGVMYPENGISNNNNPLNWRDGFRGTGRRTISRGDIQQRVESREKPPKSEYHPQVLELVLDYQRSLRRHANRSLVRSGHYEAGEWRNSYDPSIPKPNNLCHFGEGHSVAQHETTGAREERENTLEASVTISHIKENNVKGDGANNCHSDHNIKSNISNKELEEYDAEARCGIVIKDQFILSDVVFLVSKTKRLKQEPEWTYITHVAEDLDVRQHFTFGYQPSPFLFPTYSSREKELLANNINILKEIRWKCKAVDFAGQKKKMNPNNSPHGVMPVLLTVEIDIDSSRVEEVIDRSNGTVRRKDNNHDMLVATNKNRVSDHKNNKLSHTHVTSPENESITKEVGFEYVSLEANEPTVGVLHGGHRCPAHGCKLIRATRAHIVAQNLINEHQQRKGAAEKLAIFKCAFDGPRGFAYYRLKAGERRREELSRQSNFIIRLIGGLINGDSEDNIELPEKHNETEANVSVKGIVVCPGGEENMTETFYVCPYLHAYNSKLRKLSFLNWAREFFFKNTKQHHKMKEEHGGLNKGNQCKQSEEDSRKKKDDEADPFCCRYAVCSHCYTGSAIYPSIASYLHFVLHYVGYRHVLGMTLVSILHILFVPALKDAWRIVLCPSEGTVLVSGQRVSVVGDNIPLPSVIGSQHVTRWPKLYGDFLPHFIQQVSFCLSDPSPTYSISTLLSVGEWVTSIRANVLSKFYVPPLDDQGLVPASSGVWYNMADDMTKTPLTYTMLATWFGAKDKEPIIGVYQSTYTFIFLKSWAFLIIFGVSGFLLGMITVSLWRRKKMFHQHMMLYGQFNHTNDSITVDGRDTHDNNNTVFRDTIFFQKLKNRTDYNVVDFILLMWYRYGFNREKAAKKQHSTKPSSSRCEGPDSCIVSGSYPDEVESGFPSWRNTNTSRNAGIQLDIVQKSYADRAMQSLITAKNNILFFFTSLTAPLRWMDWGALLNRLDFSITKSIYEHIEYRHIVIFFIVTWCIMKGMLAIVLAATSISVQDSAFLRNNLDSVNINAVRGAAASVPPVGFSFGIQYHLPLINGETALVHTPRGTLFFEPGIPRVSYDNPIDKSDFISLSAYVIRENIRMDWETFSLSTLTSLQLLVGIALLDLSQGVYLFSCSVFSNPWVSFVARASTAHQLLQFGLSALVVLQKTEVAYNNRRIMGMEMERSFRALHQNQQRLLNESTARGYSIDTKVTPIMMTVDINVSPTSYIAEALQRNITATFDLLSQKYSSEDIGDTVGYLTQNYIGGVLLLYTVAVVVTIFFAIIVPAVKTLRKEKKWLEAKRKSVIQREMGQ